MKLALLLATIFFTFILQATKTEAAIVIYSASDAGAGSSSLRPNSDAAASSFDLAAGALGSLSTITFESAPLGPFTSLAIAPGVTITGIELGGGSQTIRNTPDGSPDSIYGYNTTSGGSRFLYAHGGSVTFTFDSGAQAFGAYISGIQFSGETITFSDGTSQTVPIPGLGINDGGIAFVGFTDAGSQISSITLHAFSSTGGHDFLGIDDVRFVSAGAAAVPEPSTLTILGFGAIGCAIAAYRSKRLARRSGQ